MTSLYLCYLGLSDPLTQTQVVAYLEGLTRAGYHIVLMNFEPRPLSNTAAAAWRRRLAAKGITWHALPYHKRPSVPATAWDILRGVEAGLRLVRRYRVRLVHARGHVPGVMALALKRLTGVRFLFDVRGFMAEEYVDAGNWPAGGLLFRTTKRVERRLVRAADGIVVLTQKARDLLHQWYPREMAGKPVEVIPCCVDVGRMAPREEAANGNGGQTIVYVGKVGTWYLTEAMVGFVAAAAEKLPELRWQVWTQSDPAPLRRLAEAGGVGSRMSIDRVPPEALPKKLAAARAGLSFIKPCLSKLSSSPTKVGEYLAAGLPVISTAGIGDVDDLLAGGGRGPVGVILPELSPRAYQDALARLLELWNDPDLPERCRAVARQELDLERVGWARYRRLYRELLGSRRLAGFLTPGTIFSQSSQRTQRIS
jgi:glycosyltransferase involved in cell wall biosynthesis